MPFKINSSYQPAGDQPEAIRQISENYLKESMKKQTLLGVTGSGKTFTMAHIIQNLQKPTLIMSHNKTLCAQLYREFKDFFPDNAVEYFVSYYDYYQPEAYVPARDLYIEKDAQINDEIDRMRVSAVAGLMRREDVIVVASVSCIYGLGAPEDYKDLMLSLFVGKQVSREDVVMHLIRIQYERNDFDLTRSAFRVRGDILDIHTAYTHEILRVEFFGDEIDSIRRLHLISGELLENLDQTVIYPAKLFMTSDDKLNRALENIDIELEQRLKELKDAGKEIEAYRLESRTRYDLEMLQEVGFCSGIENYSRHLSYREQGDKPFTLLDYFPDDYLMIIDESHQSIPQIGGMYKSDRSRKQTLVDYGFRLPSAMDNRPLRFHEFESMQNKVLYVSATPANYEMKESEAVVEQIIRPTGLVDPVVDVVKTEGQIDRIAMESSERIRNGERVLITTLTKKMAEDLSEYLSDQHFKVAYLHSEIDTLERVEIIKKLRMGVFDILVGINLLREGIDIPEVSLVCILDADKMGFLRSARSLIQIIGRSARNVNGKVILFADSISESMHEAMSETERRRNIQIEFNRDHGITPTTISKEIHDIIERKKKEPEKQDLDIGKLKKQYHDPEKLIEELKKEMFRYSENLDFENAAKIRDEIAGIQTKINQKKK